MVALRAHMPLTCHAVPAQAGALLHLLLPGATFRSAQSLNVFFRFCLFLLAGQLKGLERKLHDKLDLCCHQLEALGAALAEVARMEKPDSKNPFAGGQLGTMELCYVAGLVMPGTAWLTRTSRRCPVDHCCAVALVCHQRCLLCC